MGGSGKWVKSLIGLKKPDKEDCKVRGQRKWVFLVSLPQIVPRFLFLFCFNPDDSCLSLTTVIHPCEDFVGDRCLHECCFLAVADLTFFPLLK